MREIKFRGMNNGRWIYGSLVHREHSEDYAICFQNAARTITELQVDPETVGQFTGIKDKNENEIYEGDIVRFKEWFNGYGNNFTVEQEVIEIDFNMFDEEDTGGADGKIWFTDIEIIGNIHENPDLLK